MCFEIYSERLGLHNKDFGSIDLAGDARIQAQEELGRRVDGLSDLAAEGERGQESARQQLSNMAVALFRKLPRELRELLWSQQGKVEAIQILSDEPYIPWEFLKLQGEMGEAGRFLCEAFQVTRWLREAPQGGTELPLQRNAFVLTAGSDLPSSVGEKSDLFALVGPERVITIEPTLAAVTKALHAGEYDGWHFTGHGSARTFDPNGPAFWLDENEALTPEGLSGAVGNLRRLRPLIFLNGCETGRGGFSLTGLGGWAQQSLSAGARAFIGTLWPVRDHAARAFARTFYQQFLGGETIGEAVRQARLKLREDFPGDPTWLAYTVYAHPGAICRMASGKPAKQDFQQPLSSSESPVERKDLLSIFVSHTRADLGWGEWIAWILEDAEYQVEVPAWDFRPGSNLVQRSDRALATADRIALVLSPHSLADHLVTAVWATALRDDPDGSKRRLVPVRLEECSPGGLLSSIVPIDLVGLEEAEAKAELLAGFKEQRGKPTAPPIFPPTKRAAAAPLYPASIAFRAASFVGRQLELAKLDSAWETPGTNVITLVAFGGTGKSALVARWREQLTARCGVEPVFWSFYGQEDGERVISAEPFLADALRSLGDPNPQAGGLHERGARLARLLRQQRTLLILDGVEPLQYSAGPMAGKLKDAGLAVLLKELAIDNPGLCVVTTRQRIVNLDGFAQTAPQIELEALRPAEGVELLKRLGVNATETELGEVVEELGGHALTLTLLGSYRKWTRRGDVPKRLEVPLARTEEKQREQTFRLMAAYAEWMGERAELAIMRLLGLFDRPAAASELAALRASPAIPGLTEVLVRISDEDWQSAVERLRDYALLELGNGKGEASLNLHPLLRTYFAEELKTRRLDAWKAGNRRLFEHLCKVAPELPDTLEEMQPLFTAVVHGCRAGQVQETFDEVYWRRIQRENKLYSTTALGSQGLELTALAAFFERPWSQIAAGLTEADQDFVLSAAGRRLRALGHLGEAGELLESALNRDMIQEDWKNAAISANDLSEVTLAQGNLARAVTEGRRSVELADRCGDAHLQMGSRTTWGDALHQAGRWQEAEEAFRETERLQAEQLPDYPPRLYALQGYRYCDLLLDQAEPEDGAGLDGLTASPEAAERFREVLARAEGFFEWRIPEDSLLTIALDSLALGRALLAFARTAWAEREREDAWFKAAEHLDLAVTHLRQAEREDHLPRGLLARAACRRLRRNFADAEVDLREVLDITERGPMRLYESDAHLELFRLRRDEGQFDKARLHQKRAESLVEETGYRRRAREVDWGFEQLRQLG